MDKVPVGCDRNIRNLYKWRNRKSACHIGKLLAAEVQTPLIPLLQYSKKYHLSRRQIMRLLARGELQGQRGKWKRIFVTDKMPESWQAFIG